MVTWISQNKEWLFSGIGVPALAAFLIWTLKTMRKRPVTEPSIHGHGFELFAFQSKRPKPLYFWTVCEEIPLLRILARKVIYDEATIDEGIRITVSGQGEGMRFFKAQQGSNVTIFLDIINFNPFPIFLDRITGDVTVSNSRIGQLMHLDRVEIAKTSVLQISIDVTLSADQVAQIEFQRSNRADADAGLNLTAVVDCRYRKVKLHRQLSTGNRRFTNFS